MLFWAQEKENLSNWWGSISKRELLTYLGGTVLLLFIIFIYYYILGITGLSDWYRFQRNMGECFVLLLLTQIVTRKNLLHPFWCIGYIPFFLWLFIFPYALIHAANGLDSASFNDLSPYFLTSVAQLLLIFFIMNVICRVYVGRKLAALICLAAVLFFSFSAFIFLAHYESLGIIMTPREMFFAMTNTGTWFTRVVMRHVETWQIGLFPLFSIAYAAAYGKWIYRSAYRLDDKWVRKDRKSYSSIHRLLQFIVFFLCAWLLIRWASECFPLHDYELARQYKEYFDFIRNTAL